MSKRVYRDSYLKALNERYMVAKDALRARTSHGYVTDDTLKGKLPAAAVEALHTTSFPLAVVTVRLEL